MKYLGKEATTQLLNDGQMWGPKYRSFIFNFHLSYAMQWSPRNILIEFFLNDSFKKLLHLISKEHTQKYEL
jgi:hypothetical protein